MSRHRNRPIPSVPIATIRIAPACRSSLYLDSSPPRFGRNPRPAEKSSVSTCPYDKEIAPTDRETDIFLSQAVGTQKPRSRIESSLPSSNGLRRNRKPRHTFGIPIPGEFRTAAVRTDSDIRSIPESPYEVVPYRAHGISRPVSPNICKEGRHSEPKVSSHSAPPETIHTGDRRQTDPTATIRHGGEAFRPGIAITEYDCSR